MQKKWSGLFALEEIDLFDGVLSFDFFELLEGVPELESLRKFVIHFINSILSYHLNYFDIW